MRNNFWYAELPFGDPFGGVPYGEYNDPVTATVGVLGAGANIGAGIFGKKSAKKAARAQQAAANLALDNLNSSTDKANEALKQGYDTATGGLKSYADAGNAAVGQLQYGMGLGGTGNGVAGSLYKPFSQDDFYADPGYQFTLDQGMRGVQNSAAAQGSLLSGATLKALTRFNQDTASNQYQNSYTRYNQNQQNQLNSLLSLTGIGQNAANQTGAFAQNYATNVSNNFGNLGANRSNIILGKGDAKAAGIMGGANAITQGIGGALNFVGGLASIPGVMGGGSSSNTLSGMLPNQRASSYANANMGWNPRNFMY